MRCLITGCDLHDLGGGRWAHGDLHEVGGAYVFNAVMCDGETHWSNMPSRTDALTLVVIGDQCYFERRGVIVVSQRDAVLSDAAKRYVHGDGAVGA